MLLKFKYLLKIIIEKRKHFNLKTNLKIRGLFLKKQKILFLTFTKYKNFYFIQFIIHRLTFCRFSKTFRASSDDSIS